MLFGFIQMPGQTEMMSISSMTSPQNMSGGQFVASPDNSYFPLDINIGYGKIESRRDCAF